MLKYAKLISPHDMLSNHVTELVQGVIEGETRVLAASMTMDQIFKGTKEFKKKVFDKVQLELDQFGLHIYNANVKQLDDVQEANSKLYKKQKETEAVLFDEQKKAEAQKVGADAAFYTCQQVADGELYLKKKEAEGIAAVAEVQGFYLRNLLKEANGNYAAPKISVWSGANNGGGEGGAGGGGMKDVAGVYSMLPPLFQTVHEQTGMLWLGTLPSSS
ncbi:hypothetical protein ACSBR1_013944 [Camellia fascicularis]